MLVANHRFSTYAYNSRICFQDNAWKLGKIHNMMKMSRLWPFAMVQTASGIFTTDCECQNLHRGTPGEFHQLTRRSTQVTSNLL
jgi:hypothetical protein